MKGFFNRILNIDLASHSHHVEYVDDMLFKRYLGGKGLATHLLLERNPAGVDPLGPDNHLILAIGPASGTALWGSCRYGIYSKSPQTGFYSESYSGGTAGEYMARAGYDAIVIKGVSESPVWLEIFEDGVRFHSAKELWGLDTYATEDRVRQLVAQENTIEGRAGVIVIGPAGENGVTFSVVENDYWRSAGRSGAGAVMGSKQIKAIAFWGFRKKELADGKRISDFAREMGVIAKEDAAVKAYRHNGTAGLVTRMNLKGGFPTHYWRRGTYEKWEKISATALHERCDVRPHACLKCFMACGNLSRVRKGRHKGLRIEGPEYETIYAFGGLCEVEPIEEILYLNDICDRLGMDTISAGNLVAFAIEACRQRRIGMTIDYGDVDAIAVLLENIAYRRGAGDTLAKGIKAASEAWGMQDQAVHVKGLEPAGYDPRVLKGMGLAFGTSPRGACHLRATFYIPELAGVIDPDEIQGKAALFAEWEDRMTLFDTLILCRFFRQFYPWEGLREVIGAITGLDLDTQALRSIAARIVDNTRRFNVREGLTFEDDYLPRRFHREPLESGKVIREDEMNTLLKDYYRIRGWNEKGIPSHENPEPL